MRKELYRFAQPPVIVSAAAVVGHKEHAGPLGAEFDRFGEDDRFGQKTWEQAEAEMQRLAFSEMLGKADLPPEAVDLVFAGDLLNQCTASAFGLLPFQIPFAGLYGACSTMAEGLMLAALLTGNGICTRAAAVASSHFCTAERQFRTPLEYGGQRPPTSQWTVTGAGAALLSCGGEGPCIMEVMPGVSIERGIRDANNMGAAMAPAAMDTLYRYFEKTGNRPSDFDVILTGDLGREGKEITEELLAASGLFLGTVYSDCGLWMYEEEAQDVHAGGSGCGCSACVLCGPLFRRLRAGEYREVLLIGTGALMSPGSLSRGLPIAGIAHLVHLSAQAPGERNPSGAGSFSAGTAKEEHR